MMEWCGRDGEAGWGGGGGGVYLRTWNDMKRDAKRGNGHGGSGWERQHWDEIGIGMGGGVTGSAIGWTHLAGGYTITTLSR